MARRVETGCRDCTRCTNSAVANAGRAAGRATANVATLGMASAFTKKCKACGHVMSLHGQDAAPAPRQSAAEVRDEAEQTAIGHVDAYLRGEYPKWRLTGRELLLLRKANRDQAPGNAGVAGVFPPPPAAAPPSGSVADELRKLAELRDAGVLSDVEFAEQKARLLS